MDWHKIEKELNLHTLSFSSEHSFARPLTNAFDRSDAITLTEPSSFAHPRRSFLRANDDIKEERESALARRNISHLIRDVDEITRWASQTEGRIGNIDQILVMLTQNIEDMSKGYEEMAISCQNLQHDHRNSVKSLQSLVKERQSSFLQYDTVMARLTGLDDSIQTQEETFASKAYVSQLLETVCAQIKTVR
jgi:hypothetical protein